MAKTINLDDDEISVDEKIALDDSELRKSVANKIIATFVGVNIVVIFGVGWMFSKDVSMIENKFITEGERLINSQVIISIISATTVQLGAIMLAISSYLFPKNK